MPDFFQICTSRFFNDFSIWSASFLKRSSTKKLQMEAFFPSKHSANLTDTIQIFKKKIQLVPNIGLNPYANSVATGQDHDTA